MSNWLYNLQHITELRILTYKYHLQKRVSSLKASDLAMELEGSL